MKYLILSLTVILASCQSELIEENQQLKAKVEKLNTKHLKKNQDLEVKVERLEKELASITTRQEKEIIKSLMKLDWAKEFKKMESLDNETLKNYTSDLNKNRQSCERSIEMFINKKFTTLVSFASPNKAKYERQKLEDDYMKSVFLYKLSKAKKRLLMP